MNVDGTERGNVQERLWDDLTEGGQRQHVGRHLANSGDERLRSYSTGLQNRQGEPQSSLLHGRACQLAPAALLFVRLRDDRKHSMACLQQRLKTGDREVRSPKEHNRE